MDEHEMAQHYSIRILGRQALNILTANQRRQLLKSCLAGFVNAGLEWVSLAAVIPIFYQLVGNGRLITYYPSVLQNFSWGTLFGIILGIFLCKTVLSLWLANRQLQVTNKIYIDLSKRLYQNYFQQDYSSYTNTSYAESFRRIKNTAFDFSNHVIHGFLVLFADAMICVITTLLMAWIDYRIVVAMLLLGIPTIVFYYFFKKHWIKKIDESFRKLTPEANVILSQGIESYSEARIYHAESYFIKTFLAISDKTSDLLGKLKVLSSLPARIMEIIGIACFIAVVFFGTSLISPTETLLMLGLLSLAVYRIMPSFNRVISSLTQIQSYAYSADEISEVTSRAEHTPVSSAERLPFNHSIRLSHVAFAYERSQHDLFNDMDISIGKGEFVILTGESGSGKTTLIHMLAGLIPPTKGKILIDQHEITPLDVATWQNSLGYVPQSTVIHNDTILNNILFTKTNSIDQQHLQMAIDVSGMSELIKELPDGFETSVGEHGLSLSGGQRQRLVLARALYRNPSVLLLDEVTNQLDEKSKADVLTKLKSLTEKGITIVLSSHDRAVKPFATKEIRLEGNFQNATSSFQ
jgi:ABC-type bacteriocin/lantibiotic exporter with double-glycine peptidase domain